MNDTSADLRIMYSYVATLTTLKCPINLQGHGPSKERLTLLSDLSKLHLLWWIRTIKCLITVHLTQASLLPIESLSSSTTNSDGAVCQRSRLRSGSSVSLRASS